MLVAIGRGRRIRRRLAVAVTGRLPLLPALARDPLPAGREVSVWVCPVGGECTCGVLLWTGGGFPGGVHVLCDCAGRGFGQAMIPLAKWLLWLSGVDELSLLCGARARQA
jgi:hypothetical protein